MQAADQGQERIAKGAKLEGAIFLNTVLRTEQLTQKQLEGNEAPYICNTVLPEGIKIDKNRDCDGLPSVLHKRYPAQFSSVEQAREYVNRNGGYLL